MHELYAEWIFTLILAGAIPGSAATPLQPISLARRYRSRALVDNVPRMARRKRDDGPRLDRPGLPPLLKGHLKPGGVRANEPEAEQTSKPTREGVSADQATPAISAQPAEDIATSPNRADAVTGKATKSPADVATRPHLEGSEQGPA